MKWNFKAHAVCAGALSVSCLAPVLSGCIELPLPEVTDVVIEEEATLPRHGIYRPADLESLGARLPLVVWAEGACLLPSTFFGEFLAEIAAHNYLVIANNGLDEWGLTSSDMLIDAIDWAVAENSRTESKYFDRIDTSKIAMMGQSCGGLEALHAGDDSRVTTVVSWNSGIFDVGNLGGATKADLQELTAPTLWITGGPLDVAYPQSVSDYALVPDHVPAVLAHYDLSDRGAALTGAHLGTYLESRGGVYGEAAVLWLDFMLKDVEANRSYFIGEPCGLCEQDSRWSIEHKNWD